MRPGIFGWSYPPGCSGPPEEPEPSPESVRVQEILEAAGVKYEVIEQVTQIIDELAERATECASCERRFAEEEDRIEAIAWEELGTEPAIRPADLADAPDVDSIPRLSRYQAQINDVVAGNWLTVEAETQEDAALEALRQSRPLPDLPCSVYVGDLRTPTHDDGTPNDMYGTGIKALLQYLAEIGAKVLWAQPTCRGGVLKAYSAGGRLLLIEELDDGSWVVFVPVTDSINVEDAMAAVRAYCEPTARTADSPCADGLRQAFDRAVQKAAARLPWRAE